MKTIFTKRKAQSNKVKGCPQLLSEISYLFTDSCEIKKVLVNKRGEVLSVTLTSGKKYDFMSFDTYDIFEIHIYGSI